MIRQFRKTLPIGLMLTALFVLMVGAACVITPEEGSGGGGTPSNTSTPQSTATASSTSEEGTVDSVDAEAGQLVLTLTSGDTITVNVDQSTVITINGSEGALADLQPGDSVQVAVNQDSDIATSITAQTQETSSGSTQEGTVDSVDAEAGQLVLTLASGDTITVNVDQSTVITVNGSEGALAELQPGDSVQVAVNQDTDVANSVTVQSQQAGATETASGKITGVDLSSQTVTVETPEHEELHLRLLLLSGTTKVIIEGNQGSLYDLAKGASVKVMYNPETMVVTTIEIRTTGSGGGGSESGTGPALSDDSFSVSKGGVLEENVLTNDQNPNGGGLVVTTDPEVAPSHGSLTLEEDGNFRYAHDGSDASNDTFSYEACEENDANSCATAQVTITVEGSINLSVVTGEGSFDSPAGAYTQDVTGSGVATFTLDADPGQDGGPPTGETQFQYAAGGLEFHSDSYDQLTINGAVAQYTGAGTINGEGSYKFKVIVADAEVDAEDAFPKDRIRIQIWEEAADGSQEVIYDNGFNLPPGNEGIELSEGDVKINQDVGS